MQKTQEVINRVKIEAYSLAELLTKIQEKFTEGFVVDFVSNEGYPTSFGSYLTCDVVKYAESKKDDSVDEIKKEATSKAVIENVVNVLVPTQEVKEEVTREVKKAGRPKNS